MNHPRSVHIIIIYSYYIQPTMSNIHSFWTGTQDLQRGQSLYKNVKLFIIIQSTKKCIVFDTELVIWILCIISQKDKAND